MIVSDSSPLIALARIKALSLLPALFTQVAIPDAVWDDTVRRGHSKPGAQEIASASWILRHQVQQPLSPPYSELGAGEREAIALALEIGAEALLIDEGPGRARAKREGIIWMGTLDILLLAQRKGLISNAQPLILALEHHGFYMSDAVRDQSLRQARQLRQSSPGS